MPGQVAQDDEIDPTEMPGLYAQRHVGVVALDPRHKTHNIPGKFLSWGYGNCKCTDFKRLSLRPRIKSGVSAPAIHGSEFMDAGSSPA